MAVAKIFYTFTWDGKVKLLIPESSYDSVCQTLPRKSEVDEKSLCAWVTRKQWNDSVQSELLGAGYSLAYTE